MADKQVGNIHGVADAQDNQYFDADLATIPAMKARLQAIDAGLYTDEKLNEMTVNDMVYAIRLNDSPTTINS